MQWAYLVFLIIAIGCLVLIDRRFSLAFFYNLKRTALTLAVAVWLFIAWDILGIKFGIFFHGNSPYSLPYRIIPEFPIEELFFLFVLSYSSLLIYRFMQKKQGKSL
ncbi:lycopene cyclase domain-containing protein [Candidatus Saccharibacteria bacterium]|nr:lycopene cyclase domain-containing protein [Candidatus Saccharibacteria bacterium]